ncbi:MAG: hypothetical protein H7259_03245 [Cytophagales bacterium]|nr:hypothetical protein [Cytophaga sp.]
MSQKIFDEAGNRIKRKMYFIFDNNIILNYSEILNFFKLGYLYKTYNQIDIIIENKKFVSYVPVWNEEVISEFEKTLSPSPTNHRQKYFGKYKPWYLDAGAYSKLPNQTFNISALEKVTDLPTLTAYLTSLGKSSDPNWDCSFVCIGISDFSSVVSVYVEQYLFRSEEEQFSDRPHAYFTEFNGDEKVFKQLFSVIKKVNFWDTYDIEFKLNKDGSSDYYMFTGDRVWKSGKDVSPKTYAEFEKELEEGAKEDRANTNESITEEYLLSNIFGCVAANAPDEYVWVIAEMHRTLNADGTPNLSGNYFYSMKEDKSDLQNLIPGEWVYPINVSYRLFEEFYAELTKNWSSVRISFNKNGQAKIEVLTRL